MSVLEKYESATELTRQMLTASRTQNWDELAAVGATRESLLGVLPKTLPPMSAQDSQKIARLIEEILACHAEISDRAVPWLKHTATLLAAFDQADHSKTATLHNDTPEMR